MSVEPTILTKSGFERRLPPKEQVAKDVQQARLGRAGIVITSSIDSSTGFALVLESEDTFDEPLAALLAARLDSPSDDFRHIAHGPPFREFCRFWDAVAEHTGSVRDRFSPLITFGQTGSQIEANQTMSERQERPTWQMVAEIGARVPDAEWANVPQDLARNVDHYLYGTPKSEGGA